LFSRLGIFVVDNAAKPFWELILDLSIQKEIREILAIGCFIIWRERCNHIFKEHFKTNNMLIEEVREE
jgi:hypothetical protein